MGTEVLVQGIQPMVSGVQIQNQTGHPELTEEQEQAWKEQRM